MEGAPRVKRVMTQAINVIFELLKTKDRCEIWLYENTNMKIEGTIVGFDEYMNIVLDDAEEVYVKTNTRKALSRMLLKGDCITLIKRANP